MNHHDEDAAKGAVEQDRRGQKTNFSLTGQNPHRDEDPRLKSHDSDYRESGQNEEHTGKPRTRNELEGDAEVNPEGVMQDQAPGFRQREDQNKTKDDPLAA